MIAIGDAIGRPLRYQEIPPEAAKRGMATFGFPEPGSTPTWPFWPRPSGGRRSPPTGWKRSSAAPRAPTPSGSPQATTSQQSYGIQTSCPHRSASSRPTWRLRTQQRSSPQSTEPTRCSPGLVHGRIPSRSRFPGHAGHRPGDAGNRRTTHPRWSAPRRSAPCLRPVARCRRNTTQATGSSCGSSSVRWHSRAPQALRRTRTDGGHPSGQRPGLDRRTTATADRQALTGSYRTAYGQNRRRGLFISRPDVAHHMLRVLEQPETIKQAIGIAN